MQPCPQCGTMLAESQRYCTTCGYDKESVHGTAAPSMPLPTAPVAPPQPPPSPYELPSGQTYTPAPSLYPPPQLVYTPPPSSPPQNPYEPSQAAYPPQQQYPSQLQQYPPQPQQYPSQQFPPTRPPITPTPSQVLPDFFGPTLDPSLARPADSAQALFQRNLPQFATNPIAGAIVGGVAAVLGCLILTFLFAAGVGSTLSAALSSSAGGFGGIFTNSFTSNIFNIIALEHHVGLVLNASISGVAGSMTISLPILLLLAIPATCLVIGGYVAAATDYTNQVRFVIGRAAAVGPVYGVVMATFMTLFGTQSLGGSVYGLSGSVSFGGSAFSMLIYGIFWGTLFSSLGGFIKFFGWRWRGGIVAILLSKQRAPFVSGAIGAGAAVGLGVLLMSVLVLLLYGDGSVAAKLFASISGSTTDLSATNTALGLLNIVLLLFALPLSIWAFSFASGGGFDTTTVTNTTTTQTITIFDPHIPHPMLLLLLIPIIAFFVGGRVAARLTSSNNAAIQAQAGAFMGVFSGLFLGMLAFLSDINVSGAADLSSISTIGNLGPNPFSTFLGAAVMGAIVGGIGGYLYRAPAPKSPTSAGLFAPIDRLVQQQPGVPRPIARTWLYVALISAVLMAALAIFLDLFSGTLVSTLHLNLLGTTNSNSSLPLLGSATGGVIALVGGLMLAVPFLLFVVSFTFDLLSLPEDSALLLSKVAAPTHSMPVMPPNPPSAPYTYPSNPYTTPLPPPIQH